MGKRSKSKPQSAAACRNPLGREYEYEEQLYLQVNGSATVIVDASIASLVALRGLPLDTSFATRPDRAAIRKLDGAQLREVASTRLLILAGGLVAEGLSLRSAVQSAIIQALSDDPDVVRALGELVDAVLPRA